MSHPTAGPRTTLPPPNPSPAERWFIVGAELVRAQDYERALEPLEQALTWSVNEGPGAPYLRRLRSNYGVAIAAARGDVSRGRRLCEEAVGDGTMEAELYVNLGRVYLMAQRRDLAYEALRTALAIESDQPAALELFSLFGPRRPPVFRGLARNHPINKYAGILLQRFENSKRGSSTASVIGDGDGPAGGRNFA